MNEKQKMILKGVAATIVLMCIFPPFAQFGANGFKSSSGFALIFSGPASYSGWTQPAVDIQQLLVQVLAVCAAGVALWFAAKD